MTHRRLSLLAPVALAAVLAAPPAGAFAPDGATAPLEFRLASEAVSPVYTVRSAESVPLARAAGLAPGWTLRIHPRTGLVHTALGGQVKLAAAVTSDAQADALARSFLLSYPELLGVREDNLQLRNVRHALGKYAVHYRQTAGGTAVRNADAWVLMDEAGRVSAFGSDFFPSEAGESPGLPTLGEAAAVTAAANALGATPLPGRPTDVQATVVPAASGELMKLTPAYVVTFETDAPVGKWQSIVHGRTGEILARRNLFLPVNVVGHAQGDVQNQQPTRGYCDGSGIEPYAHMRVSVQGGNTGLTDSAGDFDISHGGASAVDVTATLFGPYIDVNRFTGLGSDASITQTFTPGTPSTFPFTTGNARQDEMDVFFHGNRVRDFMISVDPTFTQLDLPVVATVGRTDVYCPGNAWWNIGGGNMNFCEGDPTYGNTGEMSNVVTHEYGHGVTEMVYSRNGQSQPVSDLHEGNSDVIANFLDRNSVIGYGFYLNDCTGGIRDANNSLQWPADNDGGHSGGQIIAGFHWDAWQTMLALMPQAEADSVAFSTWHYARDLGTPTDQQSQVDWVFMVDDDDANLNNGTPHYAHFAQAAINHGFSYPADTTFVLTHAPLANTTDDVNGYDVVATIRSTVAPLDPSELKVTYQVNGGADQTVLFTATGNPDEYVATIPAQNQHSEVTYYLTAKDMGGRTLNDPPLVPLYDYAFDVAAVRDDLESGAAGWTAGIPSDDATTGQWGLFDPVGTAAQPGADSTPDPGIMCFITGQCGSGYGTCNPGCPPSTDLGCNDVDGGTTTLLSPVYDVSGYDQVTVKYDRWYSNNTGADPNNDTWVVDISNDGGSSWTNIESTMTTAASWSSIAVDVTALFGTPGQVQLRFIASDLNAGSIVEAGVDELRILATSGGAVAADLPVQAQPAALALEQNRPNPFSPATTIRFSIPQRSDVRLSVYDVAGRAVRELARGPRDAGRYTVTWDGRDGAGSRVSAGVYFYRLTAGGEVLTRKMTVLK